MTDIVKLKNCRTEQEVFSLIADLRKQGISTAQIPNGEFPSWYLYGLQGEAQMQEVIDDTILAVILPHTGRIAVSELYLQQDENGDYLLVH